VICVLGQDHFGGALDKVVSGERINSLPVTVKHVNAVEQAASCQILFIDRSEQRRLDSLLSALNLGVLTVSDMPGFLNHGGMIEFQLINDRVRFEVNLSAAEKSGLSLSSDLLKVAVRVMRAGA
jgi:transcriptional regulator of aromatic amino acid metabolism